MNRRKATEAAGAAQSEAETATGVGGVGLALARSEAAGAVAVGSEVVMVGGTEVVVALRAAGRVELHLNTGRHSKPENLLIRRSLEPVCQSSAMDVDSSTRKVQHFVVVI